MDTFGINAVQQAIEVYNETTDIPILYDDIYVVWAAKTLQNKKQIVGIDTKHHIDFFEVTYNGDKNETYVDMYVKCYNISFSSENKQWGDTL